MLLTGRIKRINNTFIKPAKLQSKQKKKKAQHSHCTTILNYPIEVKTSQENNIKANELQLS